MVNIFGLEGQRERPKHALIMSVLLHSLERYVGGLVNLVDSTLKLM